MKIKSIVLTAALVAAFSAFSDSVYVDWFATNATTVTTFDRAVDNPLVVTNSVSAPSITISGYAVTAYVTNLVVFASEPSTPGQFDSKYAKGSIHARSDGWYALSNNTTWVKFDDNIPLDNSAHALKMEFMAGPKVRYTIDAGTPSDWFDSPTFAVYEEPTRFAFAGMGGCTNIVGEVFIDVTTGNTGVIVDDADGKIIIPTSTGITTKEDAVTKQANQLEAWVNYVLGIDGSKADAKPYAAPVQNNSSNTLTFKLGGVHALDQSTTGAKVTYTVEELATPAAKSGTENDYVGPNDPVNITLTPSATGVKYYRIKIKIDPAH